MNFKTIATTTLLVGLGLAQPLSAQTLKDAKAIKVDLSNSSVASTNAKQLYIQLGQPYYANPLYWSWGLFFNDYYDDYYSRPYYSGYGYYGDSYYWRGYNRRYNNYYSVDRIRDIYREVLGREPDYRGLRTWLGERRSGDSLYEIRRNIARSDEAEAKINQIYREVLGRNADREGIRTWTNRLAAGASIYEVRRDIENSPEARSLRNSRYPAYNPSFNYPQPRRYAPPLQNFPPNTPPAVTFPNRNFPRNNVPTVTYPNRSFPPAISPSNNTPYRSSFPRENYQQPPRSNSPSRNTAPSPDYILPNERNSGFTPSPVMPQIPPNPPRPQR